MRKETTTLSAEEAEDIAFLFAMKESERSGKGSLNNVKEKLTQIASGK